MKETVCQTQNEIEIKAEELKPMFKTKIQKNRFIAFFRKTHLWYRVHLLGNARLRFRNDLWQCVGNAHSFKKSLKIQWRQIG